MTHKINSRGSPETGDRGAKITINCFAIFGRYAITKILCIYRNVAWTGFRSQDHDFKSRLVTVVNAPNLIYLCLNYKLSLELCLTRLEVYRLGELQELSSENWLWEYQLSRFDRNLHRLNRHRVGQSPVDGPGLQLSNR